MSFDRTLIATAAVGVLAACGEAAHREPARGAPVEVTTTAAHDEALPVLYRASGTVRGRSTVVVTSKIAGYVQAIHVWPGAVVKAGELLVELEANGARAGVGRRRAELAHAIDARAEAEGQVAAARAAAELAGKELERGQQLVDAGAITRQAFDQVQAQASVSEAQLAAAEARLRGATSAIDIARAALAEGEATLDDARVTAPFAGRVIERRVDPGALASPATPLLVLADDANLRVEVAVAESRAPAIHVGDAVTVEVADRAQPVAARVGEIVPSVDVASRAFVVKVDVPAAAGAIAPGTFARVGFVDGTRSRLVVPTTAVSSLGALDRLYVVEGGAARLRMIGRGEAFGPWTEVLSGLASGERVVVDPGEVRDGARVVVRR